jgi:hypothetical protein
MDMNQSASVDKVEISFTGLDADSGLIDIHDLSRALDGWWEFWEHSTAVYFNKELSTKPILEDIRTKIKICAFEPSSFDVFTQIIIPLALMTGYDIVKSLWKWHKSLIKRHIDTKKTFATREKAIEDLELLAREYNIVKTSTLETVKFMDIIDDALNDLVEPIDRSAKTIIIKSEYTKSKIYFGSSDKLALKSIYYIDPSLRTKDFEKHSVKFIRINTETGHALITFDNPIGLHQMGHEYSKIIDPAVTQPRNVYTRAFYEGTSLEVWTRMIRSKKSNKFVEWEISAVLPSDDEPLFNTDTINDPE